MCELKDFSHLTREERLECLSSYWTIFVNSDDGDKDAFACIYKLSIDDLYSYGLSLGADEDTCEDIIHEMFCTLYSKHEQLGHINNAMGYMIKSVRNKLMNMRKHYARITDDDPAMIPFAADVTVTDHLINEEEREKVKHTVEQLLRELTPRQREAIYLRYMQNLEYDEIAKMMDMNVDSVRKLVYRAFITMRRHDLHNIPFILILLTLSQQF